LKSCKPERALEPRCCRLRIWEGRPGRLGRGLRGRLVTLDPRVLQVGLLGQQDPERPVLLVRLDLVVPQVLALERPDRLEAAALPALVAQGLPGRRERKEFPDLPDQQEPQAPLGLLDRPALQDRSDSLEREDQLDQLDQVSLARLDLGAEPVLKVPRGLLVQ
jgi:hypothetical protein